MEEKNFKIFLKNFGIIHEFKFKIPNSVQIPLKSISPYQKHVIIFIHGFCGSQWDFEYIKSQIYLDSQNVMFYSVKSIEGLYNDSLDKNIRAAT